MPPAVAEPGSITWFLARAAQQPKAHRKEGQPDQHPCSQRDQQQQERRPQPCMPQLALRSSNRCQQLLAQQLGWRLPPSLASWQQVQQRQPARVRLRLGPQQHMAEAAGGHHAAVPVACLDIQQQPGSSSSGGSLVAVGYAGGLLRLCRLAALQDAAAAALAGEAALPADARAAYAADPRLWAAAAASWEGVAVGAGWPPAASPAPGTTWQLDTREQLRGCCWLRPGAALGGGGGEGVLVTAGPGGVVRRHFAEGRVANSSLRDKGGGKVVQPCRVVAADPAAAYQLAAATAQQGLLLWDLRAAAAAAAATAAADVPARVAHSWLQPMPGGELLLAADRSGQVVLYDVRRMSSSSIINFGSSRASKQVVATFNLRARAEAAGHAPGGGSSGVGGGVGAPGAQAWQGAGGGSGAFLEHVALNPCDANLLAYARPDLQVGVFDLHSNRVLQQVQLLEGLDQPGAADGAGADAAAAVAAAAGSSAASQAHEAGLQLPPLHAYGGRVCWDASGRALFAHGLLLRHHACQPGAVAAAMAAREFTPTLAAVDFGSWSGRQQRRGAAAAALAALASGSSSGGGGDGADADDDVGAAAMDADGSAEAAPGRGGSGALASAAGASGGGSCWGPLTCQGGQVVHVALPRGAGVAPLGELAAPPDGSGLLVGTACGDVLWFS